MLAKPGRRPFALFCCFIGATLLLPSACSRTPLDPSVWTHERIRDEVARTNLFAVGPPPLGVLKRWEIPIDVNTNGIARAEQALQNVEAWTGGLITFRRVSGTPAAGIVFLEGSCDWRAESTGAGDGSGTLKGTTRLYIGTVGSDCDDAAAGRYPSAVAEHELLHGLGLYEHFDGFFGSEGVADRRALAVLYTLYANPIGTTRENIRVWGVMR